MEIKPPYVVIVEDNPDDSFWLKRELKKADLTLPVRIFADGQRALDFLSECDDLPEALFLDLHLPGASGLQLLNAIRGSSRMNRIIVFVLDGSSSPKEIAECEKLGVAGYLDKPVAVDDLRSLVAPTIRVEARQKLK